MIQFEELKLELEGLHPDIIELANALGLEKIKMEISIQVSGGKNK